MDKLPQLTAEELDLCQQTFRSFDKDGANWCLYGLMRGLFRNTCNPCIWDTRGLSSDRKF